MKNVRPEGSIRSPMSSRDLKWLRVASAVAFLFSVIIIVAGSTIGAQSLSAVDMVTLILISCGIALGSVTCLLPFFTRKFYEKIPDVRRSSFFKTVFSLVFTIDVILFSDLVAMPLLSALFFGVFLLVFVLTFISSASRTQGIAPSSPLPSSASVGSPEDTYTSVPSSSPNEVSFEEIRQDDELNGDYHRPGVFIRQSVDMGSSSPFLQQKQEFVPPISIPVTPAHIQLEV